MSHLEGIRRCLTSFLLIFEEVMVVGFLLLFINLLVCFMKNFEHSENNHEPTIMEEMLTFYPIYLEKHNEILWLKSFPHAPWVVCVFASAPPCTIPELPL